MKQFKNIFSALLLCCFMVSTSACSEENFEPDPSKDWAGSTAFFNSVDEAGFQTYYNPAIGRCGDPMPFYDAKAGHFKVLYLQEFDNNAAFNYHPFWGVSTVDGATYQSLGEVLLPTNRMLHWVQVAASIMKRMDYTISITRDMTVMAARPS